MERESGQRLVRLNTMFVKKAHMDKVLRVVIERSVSVLTVSLIDLVMTR